MAGERRILIVDDDAMVARSLSRLLRNWQVTTETDGRSALELCGDDEFDVIVCDLNMPGFSGADFYAAVDQRAQARVVFLTGGAYTSNIRDFLATVDVPLMRKPYSFDELLGVLTKIADRPR